MAIRLLNCTLLLILLTLQVRLWASESSVAELWRLNRAIAAQTAENESLGERNRLLGAAVRDLKDGFEVIEDRARRDLGLVHRAETFFQIQGE
ncbi:MAG: septum formation initiator family protein [Gammaproteobacteria bacterium]|nr:septum formation initiator family protein [Gammaproteobacteria bacterium]